jgi:hypothetical protein
MSDTPHHYFLILELEQMDVLYWLEEECMCIFCWELELFLSIHNILPLASKRYRRSNVRLLIVSCKCSLSPGDR